MSDTSKAGEAPATPDATTSDASSSGEPLELLSASDITGLQDRFYKVIKVRAWAGRALRLQSLTSQERGEWERSITKQSEDGTSRAEIKGARAKLCVKAMVDRDGRKLFDDSHVGMLEGKSSDAVQQIFDEVQAMNGMAKKNVEEIAGN